MKILIQPYAKQMRNGKENPKNWPYFLELIELLKEHELIQIGVEGEKQLVPDFRKNLHFKELEKLVDEVDLIIGVDSFLQHLAWSRKKKCIVLWGQSDPLIFGHKENINLLKDRKYLREKQFENWEACEFSKDSFVPPDNILKHILSLKI